MFKYPIAVTIDTNIFDEAKYDLSENSTLRLLENYVKSGKNCTDDKTCII